MLGFGALGQYALGQPSPNPLFAPGGAGRYPGYPGFIPEPPRKVRRKPPFRRLQTLAKPQAAVEPSGPPALPPPFAAAAPSLTPPPLETAPLAQTRAQIQDATEAQEIVDLLLSLIAAGEL